MKPEEFIQKMKIINRIITVIVVLVLGIIILPFEVVLYTLRWILTGRSFPTKGPKVAIYIDTVLYETN